MSHSIRNQKVKQNLHTSPACYGNLKRSVFLLALLTSVNALASTRVTPVNEVMLADNNGCHVTVYQTPLSAQQNGAIEELCLIEGTTSGSSDHTVEKAIETYAHQACGCGADKVYVMSRSEPGKKSAHVVMVAFRYLDEQAVSQQSADPYEAIKWKNSTKQNSANKDFTYKKPGNARPVDTRRVFKDDYERVLGTVGSAKSTEMVWLRN